MTKQQGAFLTIGELAAELAVPQHILRYWETRFPMLRPLQRAGNRRYYRAEDVALAHRIHHLLNVEGYTVRGAQLALGGGGSNSAARPADTPAVEPAGSSPRASGSDSQGLVGKLREIRTLLAASL